MTETKLPLGKERDHATAKKPAAEGEPGRPPLQDPHQAKLGCVQPVPTPSRQERRTQFGIDCAELVHFTHWEPGVDHIRHLVVKNVVMKTQKIRYKLPQTRYFSMEFPETVTLSAGMSWTIPITFRPVAKEYYNDVIEFTTSFGKFNLPVRASLPEHSLEFPSNIDFSFCPIREIARRTFALKNTGELSSYFEWSIDPPFRIEPRKGELVPGLEVKVTLEFKPLDASVSHAVSVCHFGDSKNWEKSKNAQQMNVSGIGKFSHISIRDDGSRFDFGKVFIGASSTQSFVLENRTTVNANFRIKNAEKDTDPYFTFSLYSGIIPAQGQITVEVTYAPVTGTFSSEYFNITTVSGNTIPITCCGSGIGPHVTLSTKAVNFNDVPAGTAHMRALYLQNHTTCPAFYQFLVEPDSTFQIDKIWGTLNPNSTLALTVRFSPSEPINYYRRVYCLVENQDALHLDLLGTCYTEKRRPATFTYRHLERYWKRLSNGLTLMSPEQLEDMIKNDSIRTVDGALTYLNRDSQPEHPRDIPSLTDSPIADEYFRENTLVTSEVILLDAFVEFGACSRYRVIESQVVRIANRTKGKMSCVWVTPGESSGDPIFVVSPRTADILPKSVTEFRVNFLPNMDNSFYGMQLECFVYFKSMRNFRLVNEDTFTPPWCLTCTFSGNTFPPGEDTFIPKIAFHANRLDFPACRIGESVYRAIRLSNTGDTPVKFAFLDLVAQQGSVQQVPSGPDPTLASQNGAFLVKPKCGTLSQNQSQLIVFKFLPSEQRVYEQALKCCFNSSMSNLFEFQMRGAGYVPRLVFENNNTLCFKPTCVSAVTKRSFKARNLSRIPVYFEWQIPQQFAGIVSIEPKTGLLTPNGTLELICTFAPTTERKWVMKLPCHFSQEPLPDLQNARTRAPITVIGEGILGRLEADPPVVNCGAVLVNTIAEHETTIFNPSDCDIYYSLEISQLRRRGSVQSENECDSFDNESGDEEIVSHEHSNAQIHISQSKSMLPARSHHTVKIRVRLREQTRHEFRVFYRLKAHQLHLTENTVDESTGSYLQDQIIASKIEKYHLCDIIAVGVYPSLQVTDIRSEGICKTRLWQLFSLDTINKMLVSAGASMDIEQATPFLDTLSTQGEETKRGKLIENEYDHGLDVDFGVVPVGTLPTIVHLNLENSGVVPVEWMFHFPDDLEVEIEHWADPGEYTEEQLEQNLILDGNLFNIAPKHGFLKPGESQRVITSYSHEFAGLHRLPVVFKIQNGATTIGREMLLNFQGYSVLPQKICLHFHSSKHDFASVDIGTAEPPVQTYELYNGGSVPIYFELDLSPLDRLSKEHSNFPIMSCRTPQGSIGPGESVGLEWVFSPLEARRYEVDIPIKVQDGKTTIVTFRGRGTRDSNGPKGGEAMLVDQIPPIQKLLIPGQIASLSVERIRFGHVPVGSYLRQVVVVRNITKDVGLSFKWNVGQHEGNSGLKVQPSQGKLAAGESRVCKIVLIASMEPRVYLTEISCDFQDDDAMGKYHAEIQEAEKNRRETKLSLAFDRGSSAASKRSSPGSAGTSVKSRRSSKYQTLPPITQTSTGGNESAKGRRETSAGSFRDGRSSAASNMSDGAGLMFDCAKPKAFRLYLTVLARSYPMEDYRNRFSDFSTYFRENNAKNCVAGDTDERIESPLDHNPQNTILEMTASLLDDVMQDVEVQNAVELAEAEPLPYFVNLAEKPRGILSAELAELSEMIREGESDELNVLRSREFQNTLEGVLEGTLFNLVQEMNAGEFNVTVKPAFVSFTGKPPL